MYCNSNPLCILVSMVYVKDVCVNFSHIKHIFEACCIKKVILLMGLYCLKYLYIKWRFFGLVRRRLAMSKAGISHQMSHSTFVMLYLIINS